MSSNNVDRLSMLPEHIRSHILSLMPTKIAMRTSVLSTGWKDSWRLVKNLDFDHKDFYDEDFDENGLYRLRTFVDRKFSVTSQVNLFRLSFIYCPIQKSTVSNWINEAVTLNVRELDIHVGALGLPLSLFTCKTLTKLRLRCKSNDYLWECPSSVNLPCLKTLDTISSNPFVNAFKLISGCPMLESLSLEVVSHNGEEDYIFNIPTLKQLNLTLRGRSVTNKVVLHVPNLEYLDVGRGRLSSLYVTDNVSSLVKASVKYFEVASDHLRFHLLKGISGVESLSIYNGLYTLPLPIFPNMKHLMLNGWWESGQILQVLERCPGLKHLYLSESADPGWIEPKLVPACMLTNLTTINFPYGGDKRLLEYMLGNGEVLKTVRIPWKDISIARRMRWTADVFKYPKASKCCEIDYCGS